MRHLDVTVSTRLDPTPRVKQLSGMFDVPPTEKLDHHWKADLPLDDRDWQIGLIVGPSGCGKSTVARALFGEPARLDWVKGSVCDDFDAKFSIEQIAEICSAVGFNTIPSWMKRYDVLSTGKKFRVDLARHLLEGGGEIVLDEFTSVVDRQVAHIGCHAVQKYVRRHNRRFVAVTCHYDVIDWLQPDWMFEPATMTFQWRSLQRRPGLAVEIAREGREGRRIGTLFTLGDENAVLAKSRSLILDPLSGHAEEQRHVSNPNLRGTIKELAQLDGGFVVSRDGTFSSCNPRYSS